jgi:hypothetical protein
MPMSAHWHTITEAMASLTTRDPSGLSDRVRNAAMVAPNGEVLRPFEIAAEAINEPTDAGHRVLGLDARERDGPGLATEVALSACDEQATPARARLEALAALDRAEAITRWVAPNILITW